MFRDALDARRKRTFADGVGTKTKQADPVNEEDEKKLWSSGVFNTETSTGLSYIMYYYNCKLFGFRARDEHGSLQASQFQVTYYNGRKCLEYNGRLAKNVTGNFESKATPRVVRQFANPNNPRCIVSIYEKYLSLIPAVGPFYRKPLVNPSKIIFSSQVVGPSKLYEYIPKMVKLAGIDTTGRVITGHSGKVSCCTSLYAANFDEQAIMSRSGHRSNAVRAYKRPSMELCQQISDCLQPPLPDTEVTSVPDTPVSLSPSPLPSSSPVSTTQATIQYDPDKTSSLDNTIVAGNLTPTDGVNNLHFSTVNSTSKAPVPKKPRAATATVSTPPSDSDNVSTPSSSSITLDDSGIVINDTQQDCLQDSPVPVPVARASSKLNTTFYKDAGTLMLNVPDNVHKVILLQRGVKLSLELGR